MKWTSSILVAVVVLAGVLAEDAEDRATSALSVQAGADLPLSIMTLLDDVVGCYLDTPQGETIEFKPEDKSGDRYVLRDDTPFSKCDILVSGISTSDVGTWKLYSVNSDGTGQEQSFQVTVLGTDPEEEVQPDVEEEEEDNITMETTTTTTTEATIETTTQEIIPETTQENNVITEVTYLDALSYTVTIGDVVIVAMSKVGYRETDMCRLQTPDGEIYDLDDELNIDGVEAVVDNNIACGVSTTVISENLLGDWILISEESSMGSDPVERRQPFHISAEEKVNAVPNEVATIAAGTDFYIRLEKSTDVYSTCELTGPSGDESRISRDPAYTENCGFIVKSITTSDAGVWTITYGTTIVYKAEVDLTVQVSSSSSAIQTITFTVNQPIDTTLGPEDSMYCRLMDSRGNTHYDNFGRCKLSIARATTELTGYWHMLAYTTGKILAEEYVIHVLVEAASKPVVSTNLETVNHVVDVTCAVTTTATVRGGKYRDPAGNVLLATAAAGEGRYTTSYTTSAGAIAGTTTHTFVLRISEPVVSDLGIWRCGIETEEETYYGFITVLCPWAMMDPNVAASVVSEPTLTADSGEVEAVASDITTLSCHIGAPIRYCYFRFRNGSIFTVRPGQSEPTYEYSGLGLESGECGMTLLHPTVSDAGAWTCHVGLYGDATEQLVPIALSVSPKFWSSQHEDPINPLVVEGGVSGEALEYCRFVRMDGYGFTTDNMPEPYTFYGDLQSGHCGFTVQEPTILDHHPWTIVGKVLGHDEELSDYTDHTLHAFMPGPEEEREGRGFLFHLFVCYLIPMTFVILVVILFTHKRSRQWAKEHTTIIRNRWSGRTKVVADDNKLPEKDPALFA